MNLPLCVMAVVVCVAVPSTGVAPGQLGYCRPSANFMIDCNNCFCNPEGTYVYCTTLKCSSQKRNGMVPGQSGYCERNAHFMDGCNSCYCNPEGTYSFCTTIECSGSKTPDGHDNDADELKRLEAQYDKIDSELKRLLKELNDLKKLIRDVECKTTPSTTGATTVPPSVGAVPPNTGVALPGPTTQTDCTQVAGETGVYYIKPNANFERFRAFCYNDVDGGGWTVIHYRFSGGLDFQRSWEEYKRGFGDVHSEFWLGLEKIYQLTSSGVYELRVDVEDFTSKRLYAKYTAFVIEPEWRGYQLSVVGNYTGNAGDSLKYHAGQRFSTYDRDQDSFTTGSCVQKCKGGWWFNGCIRSNLNGEYFTGYVEEKYGFRGMIWASFNTVRYSHKTARMMVRRTHAPAPPATVPPTVDPSLPYVPTDCRAIAGRTGVYNIRPAGSSEQFRAHCHMDTDGGGWTLIQNRFNGLIDFERSWEDYKNGFGDIENGFWLGLEKIHRLTSSEPYELRIDLQDFSNQRRYATYDLFFVESERRGYQMLDLGKYAGNAGDSLTYHAGQKFTTFDNDQDTLDESCSKKVKGGWWFNECLESNLNGAYQKDPNKGGYERGLIWTTFRGMRYSLKSSRMMIRPKRH